MRAPPTDATARHPLQAFVLAGALGLVLSAGFSGAARARALASIAHATQPVPAPARGTARALLWRVGDADNHIYLLGSFHILKPEDYPLPATIDAAFADAERVAFEISPTEMRSPDLPRQMLAAGTIQGGPPLAQRLRPETMRRLDAYCRQRKLSLEQLSRFEPWMVALVIGLGEASRLGYEPGKGLDQTLIDRAQAAGKPGIGLESAADQIAALDSMSAAEQEQSLLEALDDVDGMHARMEALHADWRRGDAVAIERVMNDELKSTYPQLYKRIDVDRNDAWLPKLRRMLDTPGHDDTLVVVGAMHLVGPDGLVAKLRAGGYRVDRL
jgi:uncharacterized protein YbaP (TraB family)